MKKSLFTIAFALIAFMVANTVQAQSPHFTDVVFDGTTVTGKIAGLGNRSGSVEVVFTSAVTVTQNCINNGGNVVEDQSQTLVVSGGEGVFYSPGRNGSINFSITLSLDSFEGVFQPCPNRNWTAVLGDETTLKSLTFTTGSGATGSFTFE
jgi:hypothetical protein